MFPADLTPMLGEIRRLTALRGSVVVDAFVSPTIASYIGSQAMIQLNEPWLLAQFQAHGFGHREISSEIWNDAINCRRVTYHLMPESSWRQVQAKYRWSNLMNA